MNLSDLKKHIEFLSSLEHGYFYHTIKVNGEEEVYEIMFKDKVWQLRQYPSLPDSDWKIFPNGLDFLEEVLKLCLDTQDLTFKLESVIIENGIWHFMQANRVRNFVGEKKFKDSLDSLDGFLKSIQRVFEQFLKQKKPTKLELIKNDE